MRVVLSVAEKPSVAKELAAIISRQQVDTIKRPGISPYNPVFDIPNCLFMNSPARMIVTSVTGHLMEIEFSAQYKGWNSCQPVDLFTAPVVKAVKKEGENIQKTLAREAKQSNILLLWLDCDLEGENIAYEVIKVCRDANPRLDVYRARFSALVERDIFRTLKFPDRPNEKMNDAVDARQEIDLRIGAAFTRFQTLRLQKKFENVGSSVISFGPCQFPTLGFVVERSAKIQAFRPETFWCINCSHEFDNPDKPGAKLSISFNWERSRLYDQYACAVLYEMCVEGGGSAVVTQCNERPTSRQRPVPMNTIEFQMRAARLLRMSSEHAMGIAESLYQRGILSYPRTETNFFQAGIDVQGLVNDHRNHPDWGPYAAQLINNLNAAAGGGGLGAPGGPAAGGNRFLWPRAGGKDDQAHPPIHPTKCVALQDLPSEDERKVYDLVSRHFLACCSCDARGSLSSVAIGVPNVDGERFHASGLMVLERNWLDVYSQYEQWHANKVPTVRVGNVIQLRSLLMSEGRTCPPAPISESELIATMDRNGIGTDATIAAHISTIQQREYAVRNAQNLFEPTKLGLALVEGYNSMGYQLNKPQLRALIEADCQRIAKGEARKEDVVRKCLEDMRQCFLVCSREASKLDASMEKHFAVLGAGGGGEHRVVAPALSACGVCQGPMDLRASVAAAEGGGAGEGRRYLYCVRCVKSYVVPRGDLSAHTQHCLLCGFQALTVRNAETNKEHTVCPKCFSDPPAPPVGVDGVSEFRCFTCAKDDCPLAQRLPGSEVDVAACAAPRCGGFMRMKKNQKGYLLSCTVPSCKSVWWVPKFVKAANPEGTSQCARCLQSKNAVVHLIRFRFVLDRAPPGCPPESALCPCCDPFWASIGHGPLAVAAGDRRTNGPLGRAAPAGGGGTSSFLQPDVSLGPATESGSDYQAALAGKRVRRAVQTHIQISAAGEVGTRAPPGVGAGSLSGAVERVMEQVMCGCGVPSKLLLVNKDGPNKGRPFYACAKPRDQGCTFFEWGDEAARPQAPARPAARAPTPSGGGGGGGGSSGGRTSAGRGRGAGPGQGQSQGQGQGDGAEAAGKQCQCGDLATMVLTRKEGPNMGRYFYACRKARDDSTRCSYFEWAS